MDLNIGFQGLALIPGLRGSRYSMNIGVAMMICLGP